MASLTRCFAACLRVGCPLAKAVACRRDHFYIRDLSAAITVARLLPVLRAGRCYINNRLAPHMAERGGDFRLQFAALHAVTASLAIRCTSSFRIYFPLREMMYMLARFFLRLLAAFQIWVLKFRLHVRKQFAGSHMVLFDFFVREAHGIALCQEIHQTGSFLIIPGRVQKIPLLILQLHQVPHVLLKFVFFLSLRRNFALRLQNNFRCLLGFFLFRLPHEGLAAHQYRRDAHAIQQNLRQFRITLAYGFMLILVQQNSGNRMVLPGFRVILGITSQLKNIVVDSANDFFFIHFLGIVL